MQSLPLVLTLIILILGFGTDLFLRDPVWRYHPIRLIGAVITKGEPSARNAFSQDLRLGGAVLTLTVVLGTLAIASFLLVTLFFLWVPLSILTGAVMLYFSLSTASLAGALSDIKKALLSHDLNKAQVLASAIVSRDMKDADEQAIIRASLESGTENISDGIIAPLFYFAIGGAPLALAYKALNTLDSMIGYTTKRYRKFGWFAARADDVANYIPARLTGLLITTTALLFGDSPQGALHSWSMDAKKGSSPNAGIPITAFAGAANIKLGGIPKKDGSGYLVPPVGGARKKLTVDDITKAISYIYVTATLACALTFVFLLFALVV